MLDHVSITVGDWEAARLFYDAVMSALEIPVRASEDFWIGYGEAACPERPHATYLSVRREDKPNPSPGRHWCFKAPSREAVHAFWLAGIAAGGRDEGAPGLRPNYHPHYYAAFLTDPDGNRIEAVCHLPNGED